MAFDASTLLSGAVGRIIVRTNVAPPIVIEDPFGSSGGSSSGGLLDVIRPKLELYDATGALVIAVAPNGEPSDVPLVPLILVLAGAAAAAVLVYLATRK